MNMNYKIEFHTYWHCGSGLASGADLDALVVKDKNGMPFVPGKTVKGLLREAVEEIRGLQGKGTDDLADSFGFFDDDAEKAQKGSMFFVNAELKKEEYNAIVDNDAARYMFSDVANTAIDEDGIAKEHSLRRTEVVVPCIMYGEILDVPESLASELEKAIGFVKRIGQNRNRGLGRCTMSVIKEGGEQ